MILEGKKAIVTGGGRGIGNAIALSLAEAGADVAVIDLDQATAAQTAAAVKEKKRESLSFGVDVSDLSAVQAALDSIVETWGGVDIVVNNAGITRDNLLIRMAEEDWDLVLGVNLKGAFNLIRATARTMMKQKSGAIINISSIIGLMGNAGQANYAASKGGLISLTKAAAKELAPRGIRANAIAPGFIETAMTEKIPADLKEQMLGSIPLGRMGSPEDIAAAVIFLASPAAAYITGQVLIVDGGMCM